MSVGKAKVFVTLLNSLVHLFADGIGLWDFDCGNQCFDIQELQKMSKVKPSKLDPIVTNDTHWSWVVVKPSLLNYHGNRVTRFFNNKDNFNKT